MRAVRWIVGIVLFLALLLLSLQNADPVTLKFYYWWSWKAPLVFVLFVVFAVGVAVGLSAGALRSMRLSRQVSRLRREQRGRNEPPADWARSETSADAPRISAPGLERNDRR